MSGQRITLFILARAAASAGITQLLSVVRRIYTLHLNMEGQQTLDELKCGPFKWRENTLDERRRMRNDRKKRKRQRRRKEMSNYKEDTIEVLAKCLQRETKQKERVLYLARKYYLKWRETKETQRNIQKTATKHQFPSRFGTKPDKVRLFV